MQSAVAVFRPVETLEDIWVFVEGSLLDRNVDPDNILPDDTSSSNVEMPNHRTHT